jgi:peptidoglycan/LPS O-acetylase OafA/YrhL
MMNQVVSHKIYFPLLDVLRGLAALLVFAEHWRNILFQDYNQLGNPGLALKLLYMFTGAGHEAVMIFFVLSGCVIAHVVQTLHEKKQWSWRLYLKARLTRLWVVLIPALLLTVIWDQWGMFLSVGKESIYSGTGFGHVLNDPVADKSGFWVLVGNIGFLQTILVPTFGSNGPLWSIAYEFVYYLVYPSLYLAISPGKPLMLRGMAIVAAGALLAVAGIGIAASFPIWLAGAIAYWLFRNRAASPLLALPGFFFGGVCLVVCVMGSRSGIQLPGLSWDWFLAIACAFSIYFGMSVKITGRLTQVLKPFEWLSSISYSLYLLHMPMFVFLASMIFTNASPRWLPDIKHLAMGLVMAGLVFGYSIVVWSFTERKTPQIRGWLKERK